MLPERKFDKVIFLGVVPVIAAICGSVAGALFQAQSCSVVGASEIKALLVGAQMTGQQKLEFMKLYLDMTDRPWAIARSVVGTITFGAAALIGIWAASGGFKRQ